MLRPHSCGPSESGRDLTRLFRFAIVGLTTTALDLFAFALLTWASIPLGPANVASYSMGIAVSYGLNRRWTFGHAGCLSQALRFAAATTSGLAVSTILLLWLAEIMPPHAAKVVTVPIIFVWNYGAAQLWVFRPESS